MEPGWYFATDVFREPAHIECVYVDEHGMVGRVGKVHTYTVAEFYFFGRIHIPPKVEGK